MFTEGAEATVTSETDLPQYSMSHLADASTTATVLPPGMGLLSTIQSSAVGGQPPPLSAAHWVPPVTSMGLPPGLIASSVLPAAAASRASPLMQWSGGGVSVNPAQAQVSPGLPHSSGMALPPRTLPTVGTTALGVRPPPISTTQQVLTITPQQNEQAILNEIQKDVGEKDDVMLTDLTGSQVMKFVEDQLTKNPGQSIDNMSIPSFSLSDLSGTGLSGLSGELAQLAQESQNDPAVPGVVVGAEEVVESEGPS